MDQKRSKNLKHIVSGMLSPAMITSMSAVLPANAEEESSQECIFDSSKISANRRV
jgi:hypothetical protein